MRKPKDGVHRAGFQPQLCLRKRAWCLGTQTGKQPLACKIPFVPNEFCPTCICYLPQKLNSFLKKKKKKIKRKQNKSLQPQTSYYLFKTQFSHL